MAIDLNDAQYEVAAGVKIFNGGVAGIVNGVKVRVERKKATDADNAPKYKLILKDADDAEMNKGYFDGNDSDKKSDAAKGFFVKEMKHLAGLFDVKLPDSIDTYDGLLDVVMKGIYDKGETVLNVAVSYGTIERPKKFLEIGSAFNLVKATEKAYMNPKYQLTRVLPDVVPGTELPQSPGTFADNSLAPKKDDLPW